MTKEDIAGYLEDLAARMDACSVDIREGTITVKDLPDCLNEYKSEILELESEIGDLKE